MLEWSVGVPPTLCGSRDCLREQESRAIKPGDGLQIRCPARGRAQPLLAFRRKTGPLADGAEPEILSLRIVHGAGIDRCAAVRHRKRGPVWRRVRRLHVFPWFARQQPECRRRGHDGSVSRARRLLAVRATARSRPFQDRRQHRKQSHRSDTRFRLSSVHPVAFVCRLTGARPVGCRQAVGRQCRRGAT